MRPEYDVLVVGGGHGGAQAAIALRQEQFAGSLAIITDEDAPPYERPPLSKDYLAGARPFESLLLRPPSAWADRRIDLLLGRRVQEVQQATRTVRLADGGAIGYGTLIWAAGGSPRRLPCPGHALPGVHTLRTRADADRILAALPAARRIVVIGGGYIGLECAATLASLGRHVTVVEAADRVLARVAGVPLSRFLEAEHRARGVDIRLGASVLGLEATAGRVSHVRLAGSAALPADMVIVGIGIAPSAEPLLAAGADGDNGVAVDAACRTSLPGIYAIGDCALHANAFAAGARIRVESVQNAIDQAATAARAILGRPQPAAAAPWFWSHQYDLKLQTIGLAHGCDDAVVRGAPHTRSFSVVYLRRGRVQALDCVNNPRDYGQGKALVLRGSAPDRAALADPAVPIKSLLAA